MIKLPIISTYTSLFHDTNKQISNEHLRALRSIDITWYSTFGIFITNLRINYEHTYMKRVFIGISINRFSVLFATTYTGVRGVQKEHRKRNE